MMPEFEIFKKSGEICIKHSDTEFAYHCEDSLQNAFTDQFHELFSEDRLIGLDNEDIWLALRRTGYFYYKEFDAADYDTAVKSLITEISASDNKYSSMLVWIEGDITMTMCNVFFDNISKAVGDDVLVTASAGETDAGKVMVSVWAGI